ncbi:hypothetical protein [Paenibacillus alba]|uniref:DUF1565 domain-containing protein n=1 Tax=Paenibacillus alba TaxID=1197127 RepID=A0ABU6GAQ5_9BACL|nr:hypothetical protein [Paenibacillus alba]MEC0231278.1 hypothetical protein [Paenibacillus alba]
MQNTPNFGFKKPDRLTDTYKIQDQNDNWDSVDSAISSGSWKQPCRAATVSNITLAGTQTIDGVVLVVGDRVLVKNQTTATQNGIYIVATGAWQRALDADTSSDFKSGMAMKISSEGTTNTSSEWFLSNANPITLDTTSLVFTQADGIMSLADTTTATSTASRPNVLLSMLAYMIKAITGKANWYTAPAINLETVNTRFQSTPSKTVADITYYVRTDGNDSNTGTANTTGGAFRTIQRAINSIPQIVNHAVSINVAAGTYAEDVFFEGLYGAGQISIYGNKDVISTSVNASSFLIRKCGVRVEVNGFNLTTTAASGIQGVQCSSLLIKFNNIVGANGTYAGMALYSSTCNVIANNISNRVYAIYSSGSIVNSSGNTGSGNTNKYVLDGAGTIYVNPLAPDTLTATNNAINNGGVLNPWGDNTTSQRSRVTATSNATQNMSAATATKVVFQSVSVDNLIEFSSSRFTAKGGGTFDVKGMCYFNSGVTTTVAYTITIYKNGAAYRFLNSNNGTTQAAPIIPFGTAIDLASGDYIEIYLTTTSATVLSANSFLEITRIA